MERKAILAAFWRAVAAQDRDPLRGFFAEGAEVLDVYKRQGMGPPAGRKARWGKEERRSVGGLPIPIGIATRHGAKPATTRTYKSRPTPGRRTGCHHSVALRRR